MSQKKSGGDGERDRRGTRTFVTKGKRVFYAVLSAFALTAVVASLFFIYETHPASRTEEAVTERVEVPEGMTVKKFARTLKEKKLIKNENAFYLAARYPVFRFLAGGAKLKLESGVYRISSGMSVADIFALASSGKMEYVRTSFPEGLTISKIAERLEKAGICTAADFKAAAVNGELIKKYDIRSSTLEGYLFPDTYFFTPDMASSSVIDMMVKNFFEHIRANPTLASLSPEELQTTLVLASIVEREYRVADEAPLIASVFKNRIAKNIGLYSCATIEYIITEIQNKAHPDVITYNDLKIDSPYNTYKWAALPPTPISNPGMIALEAAADTPKTNYYYFRLTDEVSGRHVFSEYFDKHIKEGVRYTTKKAAEN